jgi:putative peptide zinc metalloprotease protein
MSPEEAQPGLSCLYPPRISDAVDVTQQTEDGAIRYVVRNRATTRYFLLKGPEYAVFQRIDGTRTADEIGSPAEAGGPRASRQAVLKFLNRLDSLSLLARTGESKGEREDRGAYFRFRLFNPDGLLAWLDKKAGWLLTKPFIAASFLMMAISAIGLLMRASEAAAYTSHIYANYGLATIIAITLCITALHEMAHGLACKHFGGEVPEVGVLMIFYVVPALYCNVSDIYRFGRRRERLWVIFAGIYWQAVVSAAGALVWLVATPQTLLADFAFLILLGGTFNLAVNCNPLIKLDGYYALSQMLGIQNLQARSSQYVGSIISRILNGPGAEPRKVRSGMKALYAGYWILSIIYSMVIVWLVIGWAGGVMMDGLGLAGVLLTIALALLLGQRLARPFAAGIYRLFKLPGRLSRRLSHGVSVMATNVPMQEPKSTGAEAPSGKARNRLLRPRTIKATLALLLLGALLAPWEASAGSDCALLLPPGRESAARANTDAVLAEIYVKPGDAIAEGTRVARLVNPDIEDRLTQLSGEITRLDSRTSQIEEELRIRSEALLSANFKERERERLLGELKDESGQISRARSSGVTGAQGLPPGIAVLQSEIELKQTELEFNRQQVSRYKKLFEQGLVGELQYDAAVNAVHIAEKELQGAGARLDQSLVEHRRLVDTTETGSLVAQTEARAARSNFGALISEMHSNRQQLESLRARRDILQREYEGMNVMAPRSGVVLGEDLRKMIGSRYSRGQEIFRIGDMDSFLLKIDVNERDIASVRLDSPVRFKLKTVPGRTFTGRVSKINAEGVPNQNGQRFYPVEVMIENSEGILRPGMTGFARISFGRQSIGLIAAEKLWQSLRPELWLF